MFRKNTLCDIADGPADVEAPESAACATATPARKGYITERHVPYLLATHDFVTAIGSGMTVKYAQPQRLDPMLPII